MASNTRSHHAKKKPLTTKHIWLQIQGPSAVARTNAFGSPGEFRTLAKHATSVFLPVKSGGVPPPHFLPSNDSTLLT